MANEPIKIISIGDRLKDTTLHTPVHKFQSERGVYMHPPAYTPDIIIFYCARRAFNKEGKIMHVKFADTKINDRLIVL